MKISDKVLSMQSSPISGFNVYANEAKAKGKKVYHLNIGQPDIITPPAFMEAVKNFDENVLAYQDTDGNAQLVNAIIKYFSRINVDYDKSNILVTNGGSEALQIVCMSIIDPGDDLLLVEPFYTNYNAYIEAYGGKIAPITAKAEDGYFYASKEMLEASLTDKTKAILIVNPGNPTGNILTPEDIKLICDFAIEHDLWIVADEVYREFAYDGKEMTSFAQYEEISDRLIVVDSISKRFSACGARIGFVATKNKELMDGMMKVAQIRLCCPTLEMIGAAALYELEPDYFNDIKAEYESRRDTIYEEMKKIPGIVCEKPGGAFYMMTKLPVESAEDFLMFLLTEFDDNGETVMYAPAEGFYATPGLGKNEIRIAYVLNKDDLKRAAELIKLGIEAYKAKGNK